MRGENLIRLIALIGLCALVYYFSYDQGRRAVRSEARDMEETVRSMDRAVKAKEQIIQQLASEVHRLKKELAKARSGGGADTPTGSESGETERLSLRLGASRILFEARLVLTCLKIDRENKRALIQINLVQQGSILNKFIGLGQAVDFTLGEQPLTLILEKIHSSFVSVQVIQR